MSDCDDAGAIQLPSLDPPRETLFPDAGASVERHVSLSWGCSTLREDSAAAGEGSKFDVGGVTSFSASLPMEDAGPLTGRSADNSLRGQPHGGNRVSFTAT